jgi:hypothetical protein
MEEWNDGMMEEWKNGMMEGRVTARLQDCTTIFAYYK